MQQFSDLSKSDQANITKQVLAAQKSVTQDTYYSEVSFWGTNTAGAFKMAAGVRKAFAYKQGDNMNSSNAGYLSTDTTQAGEDHTNLIQPATTVDNQRVYVYGISIMPREDSDAYMLMRLLPALTARVRFGGKASFGLGPVSTIPGGGGLVGSGMSRLIQPPNNEFSVHSHVGALTNGVASRRNFRELKSPYIWQPQNATKDSSLIIEITNNRDLNLTLPTAVTGIAGNATSGTAVVGVPAYAQPVTADYGTYVKFLVFLHAVQLSERSDNA